ncbi:MAG: DUF2061 domain-containing protein [Candidatus Marinimicrobia bacterium]|nr:DUF2061 domain-containing protein [Candidatus Neomarinimicrobiota bacterium]
MMKELILKNIALAKTVTWRLTASLITIAIIYTLTGRFCDRLFDRRHRILYENAAVLGS